MDVIDHGDWARYSPNLAQFRNLPPNILYAQRVSDGADWYLFQRGRLTGQETIKATVVNTPRSGWVVQATAHDASLLFPAGMRLIEIADADVDHESLRQNFFDPDSKTFSPPHPMALPRFVFLISLYEAGLLDQWQDYLSRADMPVRLALEGERLFAFDDRFLRIATRDLGWDADKLTELFKAADKNR